MPETRTAIAVCGVDFGWGSAGKINAIVAALKRLGSGFKFVLLGTKLGRPILTQELGATCYAQWPEEPTALQGLFRKHGVVAGLVVLDPVAANAFEAAGCPTVYVDSLPFMWSDADPVPADVAVYCAQRVAAADIASRPEPLKAVQRLTWVDPITADIAATSQRHRGMAIISLGGLHSPVNPGGNPAYCRLVIEPALRAVTAAGYRPVHLCGNLLEEHYAGAAHGVLVAGAGPRPHAEFLKLLSTTGIALVSPGLTTLLEAARLRTPVVCLPPQNLSQILNGDQFAETHDLRLRVSWPAEVLDLAAVESARARGEETAVALIQRSLESANVNTVHRELESALSAAIRHASDARHWDAMTRGTIDGAEQVAAILLRVATQTR